MSKNGHNRISDHLSGLLSIPDIVSLDVRRTVTRVLNSGEENITFRDSDDRRFRQKVTKTVQRTRRLDTSKHFLFGKIQDEGLRNLLVEEALHWDIKSNVEIDSSAAYAIAEQYKRVNDLPIHLHKQHFPLLMNGYILGHSIRVAIYATLLAQTANGGFNVNPETAAIAGFWHDIGKNEKGLKALSRVKGRFSHKQFERIKNHPCIGAEAIQDLNLSGRSPIPQEIMDEVCKVALSHHVRPDQDAHRSYPKGVSPYELTPLVQMISIADAFDAMTTRDHILQPEERTRAIERAYEEFGKFSGTQFNPELVEIFLRMNIKPTKSGDL